MKSSHHSFEVIISEQRTLCDEQCELATIHVHYLTLLCLHIITVLLLTIVYFVSEVNCTLNVLHSITP